MRYRPLGRTGIVVSELCLGAMMLGEWGNTDESDCHRMVHRALDAGINFIDTADEYAFGGSEAIVGRALKGRRDDVVLATKFNHQMRPGLNTLGNSRRWIMTAVEDSLRRLGTDYIDLYQAHRPDPDTDIDETLGALSDLIHQGKVRAIGTSAFPAEQLVEAQWVSERRGRERFATEQLSYSILARQAEAAVLPTAERYGVGVLVFSPLNGGWLAGRYRRGEPAAPDSRAARHPAYFDHGDEAIAERKFDAVEQLEAVAKQAGLSLLQLALGFVVAHRAVTSAIIGPRTYEQLEEQLGAADVTLSNDLLDRIDEVAPPGTNINPDDAGWTPPSIRDPGLRRRAGL
jgi:aryl-alcohol dehydrogenase-like predicted oxidoreductase